MGSERFDMMGAEAEAEAWAVPQAWNAVTSALLGAAFAVHTALGPGLLERLYEDALEHELARRGLRVDRQFVIRLKYKDIELSPMTLDLAVNDLVVVELKAVEKVHDAHLAQLVSQMKAARLPLGLLLNFHAPRLKDGIYRRLNRLAFPDQVPVVSSLRTSTPSEPSAF